MIQIFQFYSDFNASGLILSKQVFERSKLSVSLSNKYMKKKNRGFTSRLRTLVRFKILREMNSIFVGYGSCQDYPIFIPFF